MPFLKKKAQRSDKNISPIKKDSSIKIEIKYI